MASLEEARCSSDQTLRAGLLAFRGVRLKRHGNGAHDVKARLEAHLYPVGKIDLPGPLDPQPYERVKDAIQAVRGVEMRPLERFRAAAELLRSMR